MTRVPGKAAYLQFENDSAAEFEFQLAEHLHKTVAEIREMDHDEYVRWNAYLLRKQQLEEIAAKQRRG